MPRYIQRIYVAALKEGASVTCELHDKEWQMSVDELYPDNEVDIWIQWGTHNFDPDFQVESMVLTPNGRKLINILGEEKYET